VGTFFKKKQRLDAVFCLTQTRALLFRTSARFPVEQLYSKHHISSVEIRCEALFKVAACLPNILTTLLCNINFFTSEGELTFWFIHKKKIIKC